MKLVECREFGWWLITLASLYHPWTMQCNAMAVSQSVSVKIIIETVGREQNGMEYYNKYVEYLAWLGLIYDMNTRVGNKIKLQIHK